jgi:hypothetical protein
MPRPTRWRWCAPVAVLAAVAILAANPTSGLRASDTTSLFCAVGVDVRPVPDGVEARCVPDATIASTVPPTSSSATTTTQPPTTPTTTAPPAVAGSPAERLASLSSTELHDVSPIPGMNTGWDWDDRGRSGVWPPFTGRAGHNVWGQVVKAVAGSPTNVSVQVSEPVVYLRVGGVWVRACADQVGSPGGGWFTASSYASTSRTKSIATDPTSRVSTFGVAPLGPDPAVFWHWWYMWPRCPFPAERGPVAVVAWMRLVGPDAGTAQIMGALAGDTYTSLSSTGPSGDLGIPRHALAGPDWRLFGYVTASPQAIVEEPPPIPPPP